MGRSVPFPQSAHIPASLARRIAAYAVDCSILFGGLVVWQGALYPVNPVVAAMRDGTQPDASLLHAWVFATATVPFLVYFALTQSSARQATLGQRWLKLKVESTSGERISVGRAFGRCAVMLVPFELNHTVLFHLMPREGEPSTAFSLGYAVVWAVIAAYLAAIPLTPHRQSVHDLVAGTVVTQTG